MVQKEVAEGRGHSLAGVVLASERAEWMGKEETGSHRNAQGSLSCCWATAE